jgi:hypothetical protein
MRSSPLVRSRNAEESCREERRPNSCYSRGNDADLRAACVADRGGVRTERAFARQLGRAWRKSGRRHDCRFARGSRGGWLARRERSGRWGSGPRRGVAESRLHDRSGRLGWLSVSRSSRLFEVLRGRRSLRLSGRGRPFEYGPRRALVLPFRVARRRLPRRLPAMCVVRAVQQRRRAPAPHAAPAEAGL